MGYVLIVDDDCDGAKMLKRFLERRLGCRVECVPDGEEAIGAIVGNPPDVLVLDLNMPRMDGLELLRVLRSYARLKATPVVMVSADAHAERFDRARELGVVKIFLKASYKLEDLAACIKGLMGERPAFESTRASPSPPSTPA